MSALNTQEDNPLGPNGHNPAGHGLVLPSVSDVGRPSLPPGTAASLDASKESSKHKGGAKSRHHFLVNLQVGNDGAVYLPKPDPNDPTTKVEQALRGHLSKSSDLTAHCVDFDGQSVRLKVRGPEALTASLRARLADVSATSLQVKLTDSRIVLHQALSTSGEIIPLTPGESAQLLPPRPTLQQLIAERNRDRRARLLDLQYNLLGAITRDEYEHTKPQLIYPESAAAKLRAFDDAMSVVLWSHTKPLSHGKLPTWLHDLHRAVAFSRTTVHSTHPHIDAVLLIVDPDSKLFKAVATNRAFQEFLRDLENVGIFPSLFQEGRAKLALRPILKNLIAALPPESA